MAEIKFEEALKRLEKIVENLEDGNLSLDESLEKYEEGIRLSQLCAKRLEVAKKKVELLLKTEDGGVELKTFDESSSDDTAAKPVDSKKKKPKDSEDNLF